MNNKLKVLIGQYASLSQTTINLMKPLLDENVELLFEKSNDFDVLICGSPSREDLEFSSKLHDVIMPWAGISPQLRDLIGDFPQIHLHNSHHNAVTTGEMAIALMMAAARSIPSTDAKMHQCDWSPRNNNDQINYVLYGRTALILGFGAIGQHVALTCQALGMNVLGIRRSPKKPILSNLNAKVYGPEALDELLPKTNVLIITIPGTDETRGMIGSEQFALMPDNGLLINVGRGEVVDQHALYKALQNGKLHAAGIDVWYNYPEKNNNIQQPADVPIHELTNVVMSPHRGGAGGTGEAENLRAREMARLLNTAARGEPMPNLVDISLGY